MFVEVHRERAELLRMLNVTALTFYGYFTFMASLHDLNFAALMPPVHARYFQASMIRVGVSDGLSHAPVVSMIASGMSIDWPM